MRHQIVKAVAAAVVWIVAYITVCRVYDWNLAVTMVASLIGSIGALWTARWILKIAPFNEK